MPESYRFHLGKAHVFHLGKDATIIATGIMVSASLEARQILESEGLDVGVINVSTIKPLDAEAVLRAAETSRLIVTVEEHSVIGGLGSAVSEVLSEKHPVTVKRMGVKDTFGRSGKPEELLEFYGLTPDTIVSTIKMSL
jgi:transketolase